MKRDKRILFIFNKNKKNDDKIFTFKIEYVVKKRKYVYLSYANLN